MIRRDYILRMIAEFMEVLSRLQGLKKGQLWREATGLIDGEFQRLVGAGAEQVEQLSETELLARVIRGEPTQVVRDKTLMLTALLKEAGDSAAAQGQADKSRAFYLKGLDLLLGVLAEAGVSDWPGFAPQVAMFTSVLGDAALPLPTLAGLMRHYECGGEFAKAEDALFAMLEAEPQPEGLLEFGTAFYERLRGQADAALAAGNLPRAELEAGLAELRRSLKATESERIA
ncbi:MAG TPA: DUF6483 family protein [Verrucomicrobiae bacterium]